MSPTVLLAATETPWLGTARMPRDLARAGWNVALLTPPGSLAEHSGYLHRIARLPDNASGAQWLHAFAGTVRAVSPQLVLPCDDVTFRLLQQLVLAPPANLQPELRRELHALVTASLGDPAHYRSSVDKTRLPAVAEAAGVAVPPWAVVHDIDGARDFAAAHGWPVVLKRTHSSGGLGVAVCGDATRLAAEFTRLAQSAPLDLGDSETGRMLVQRHVQGRTRYFAGTAWQGRLLCGYAVDKLDGDEHGPASVVRYWRDDALHESAERLARATGASGIFAPEYLHEESTGRDWLVEVNRRITPGTHRGALFGMSSGAALLAAAQGRPAPVRERLDAGEEHVYVSFPHEWLRNPESPALTRYPVDVPWDEPALTEAMLALRHAS